MAHKQISAGGVVYRRGSAGLEIQLIVDRYGRVALPKGKMEEGETVEETALREIREETGAVGMIRAPIDIIKYTYEHRTYGTVDKEVHYFLVEAVGGITKAQAEEINAVEWHGADAAWERGKSRLYANNVPILQKAMSMLGEFSAG
ncbi:NTP pyrophosphohydrolase [Paenibacillus sp. FSL R7-0273]|uniref:NUDIX hydrolase n=1 Tax=Paenibacillus sp. FSL R7-0273 TaxID=1536772 RepID=UPI0004F5E30C|nr:NUDIX domain-containing protein [Paenibacillus sp. FSL R7-0273]AIQ48799.1 NTP pyrophosphohydrolase [Paenibacillus sp. FSL R7-0273]OMF93863.1 NTP pyrophosphohydrolase [Paenibacillus sp. FSL R7-0273]